MSKAHGATSRPREQIAITPLDKLTGFDLEQAQTLVPAILGHYFTRVRAQRSSETVPLVDTTDLVEMQNRIVTRLEEAEVMKRSQIVPKKQGRRAFSQATLDRVFDEMIAELNGPRG